MKALLVFGMFLCCLALASSAEYKCKPDVVDERAYANFTNMEGECIKLMTAQVHNELNAALTYLAMGAHFSQDQINRHGFAKLFFESASEEREHAIKFIEYLLMRGELENSFMLNLTNHANLTKIYPAKYTWDSGLSALKDALALEVSVTASINEIIKKCENPNKPEKVGNDYHLVDYLTAEFLDEQYKGQRELAGRISTLGKMQKSMGDLGEFMYDKKLLDGELPGLM